MKKIDTNKQWKWFSYDYSKHSFRQRLLISLGILRGNTVMLGGKYDIKQKRGNK